MSELRGLQSSIRAFGEADTKIVAICVDAPEQNRALAQRMGLEFPILSDPDLELIDAFGLRHDGGAPTGAAIARPALYLVRDGVIRWRSLTDNWRIRPRPAEILAALRALEATPGG